MDYQVVYDLSVEGYKPGIFIVAGILFIFIGYSFQQSAKERNSRIKPWFANIFFWGSVIWTIFVLLILLSSYLFFTYILITGKYDIVEGTVTDFVSIPNSGRESFMVNNKHFSYSQYNMGLEFHHTKSHGGPIDEGIQVRISYVGNNILRLEVAK